MRNSELHKQVKTKNPGSCSRNVNSLTRCRCGIIGGILSSLLRLRSLEVRGRRLPVILEVAGRFLDVTGRRLGSFGIVGVSGIFFNDTMSFSVKTSSAKLIVLSPFGILFFLIALERVLEVLEVTGFEVTGLYNGLSFILTLTTGTINSFSSKSALAFLAVAVASFDV